MRVNGGQLKMPNKIPDLDLRLCTMGLLETYCFITPTENNVYTYLTSEPITYTKTLTGQIAMSYPLQYKRIPYNG